VAIGTTVKTHTHTAQHVVVRADLAQNCVEKDLRVKYARTGHRSYILSFGAPGVPIRIARKELKNDQVDYQNALTGCHIQNLIHMTACQIHTLILSPHQDPARILVRVLAVIVPVHTLPPAVLLLERENGNTNTGNVRVRFTLRHPLLERHNLSIVIRLNKL